MVLWESGRLCTVKNPDKPENEGTEYKDYFKFEEAVKHIPPHRILAMNRGEKENALRVKLEFDAEGVQRLALERLPVPPPPAPDPAPDGAPTTPAARAGHPLDGHPHAEFLKHVTLDALARLLLPSLENEI